MADDVQRFGSAVLLTGSAVADLNWIISVNVAAHKRTGTKVPRTTAHLHATFGDAVAVLREEQRHRDVAKPVVPQNHCIGSDEAAKILGMSRRQVQRIASSLEGQLSGTGAWQFDRRVVEDYGAARAA